MTSVRINHLRRNNRVLVTLLFLFPGLLFAQDNPGNQPAHHQLDINGVSIGGITAVIQLKPEFGSGELLQNLITEIQRDNLDEIVFLGSDGTLWMAYGDHIRLYAESSDRVREARYGDIPVTVLAIDKESATGDLRPAVSRTFMGILIGIVLVGGLIGGGFGLSIYLRVPDSTIGPLLERVAYGIVMGGLVSLLVYGLSDHRFDMDALLTSASHSHLERFTVEPLPAQTLPVESDSL